jgi:pilus assembly protein Flp/PilA
MDIAAMNTLLKRLLVEEDGPTAVEYAVMLALIVGLCIGSVGLLSAETGNSFTNSATQINSVLGS